MKIKYKGQAIDLPLTKITYPALEGKPSINGVTLEGDLTSEDLHIGGGDTQYFDVETVTAPNGNLIGFADGTYEKNGITLTINDGLITLSGTNTGTNSAEISVAKVSPDLEAGQYYVLYEYIEGEAAPNALQFQLITGQNVVPQTINNASLKTLSATQNRTKFVAAKGASFVNYKIHFWITKDIEPYVKYGEGGTSTTVTLHDDIIVPQVDTHAADEELHFTATEKTWIQSQIATSSSIFDDEIEDTVEKVMSHQRGVTLNFAWISDTHVKPDDEDSVKRVDTSYENINKVNKKLGLDFVAHTGDFVDASWAWHVTSKEEYCTALKDATENFGQTIVPTSFITSGNHDGGMNTINDGLTEVMWASVCKSLCLSRNYMHSNAVFSSTNEWFYVDYVPFKLRCIYFSPMYLNDKNKTSVQRGYHYDNVKFMKDALESVPDSWNVFLFSHMAISRFSSTFDTSLESNRFYGILNGYNQHIKVDLSGSSLDCDFSNKTGKILAHFTGHYHGDSIVLPTDEHAMLNFPEISVCSANSKNVDPEHRGTWYDDNDAPARQNGTFTQDAWDVVTYNESDAKIYLTRFGAGNDREVDCSLY